MIALGALNAHAQRIFNQAELDTLLAPIALYPDPLRTHEQQYVYQQAQTIVVQPVYPNVVYAPYYDPYVVYGTWWWPAYRPVFWRPWVARPIFVTRVIQPVRIVQPARFVRQPVHLVRPIQVTPYHAGPESRRMPIIQSAPAVTQPVG